MIKSVLAYELYCQKCAVQFEGGDFTMFANEGQALEWADAEGWQVYRRDGFHFCPECREFWPGLADQKDQKP